jgi:hypothetical protein
MIARFVRSLTYAQIRLVFAFFFIVLGALVAIRTFAKVGLVGAALPAYVLAGAMIALGAFRIRTYLQIRAQTRQPRARNRPR